VSIVHLGVSDHAVVKCILSLKKEVYPKKTILWRNLKNIKPESFADLLNSNMPEVSNLDPEDALLALVSHSFKVFDIIAPLKTITKISYPRKVLISSATKNLMKERNLLQRKSLQAPRDAVLKSNLITLKKNYKFAQIRRLKWIRLFVMVEETQICGQQ
jgi:hypothetical protein